MYFLDSSDAIYLSSLLVFDGKDSDTICQIVTYSKYFCFLSAVTLKVEIKVAGEDSVIIGGRPLRIAHYKFFKTRSTTKQR